MNSPTIAILTGFCLALFGTIAQAQEETNPVPHPPYLAPVPDYGHWTVTLTYKSNAPPAATAVGPSTSANLAAPLAPAAASAPDDGAPTMIDTIKTGDLRGVVLSFADGSSKQFTCQGDWILTSTAKGPQIGVANSQSHPYMYYTTGFILLDGVKIDQSTFKEAVPRDGVLTFHYKSREVNVWIDPSTMLPLVVKQPGAEASYKFLNPPPKPFPIPQDQESLLQKEQNAYKAVQSMR